MRPGSPKAQGLPKYVLDTVALRGFAFAHPRGLRFLLQALGTTRLYCPAEVYAFDEDTFLPEDEYSELARGLRFARSHGEPRYRTWWANAAQLGELRQERRLVVLKLNLSFLRERNQLQETYGIGRGEAAALVLARAVGGTAVFVSADGVALRVAKELNVPALTLLEVLERLAPRLPCEDLEALLDGLQGARFGLREEDRRRLLALCRGRANL